MRQLLDTHALLWFLQDSPRLPEAVAARIESSTAVNLVSIASVWEMAIKISLGKLHVPYSLNGDLPSLLEEGGMALLPIGCEHLGEVSRLPFHHRDPFDRILIAQAKVEQLTLVSRDKAFDAYGVSRFWG